MRKAKRLAKAKKLVVKNLTYLRLKNDLAIIENEDGNSWLFVFIYKVAITLKMQVT